MMADKYFIRKYLNQLQDEISSFHFRHDKKDPTRKAKLDVLYAEVGQLLGLALPPGSPLLALFNKFADEASATSSTRDPVGRSANADPTDVLIGILAAAQRWNEARVEPEATAALAEDVNRILSRNFLKHPVVFAAIAALIGAAAFAIFGVIRFEDMKVDVKGAIEKVGEEAKAEINEGKDGVMNTVKTLQADAEKLNGNIESANKRVSELTISAVEDQVGTVEAAAASAAQAVEEASRQGIEKIEQATRLQEVVTAHTNALRKIENGTDDKRLKDAVDIAERSIQSNAKQYVEDVKSKVAPAFNDAIKEDTNRLQDFERRLGKADSQVGMVDAALRAMGTPGNKVVNNLAAYFNETILTVYIVLGFSSLMFVVNLVLMFVLLRRGGRGTVAS